MVAIWIARYSIFSFRSSISSASVPLQAGLVLSQRPQVHRNFEIVFCIVTGFGHILGLLHGKEDDKEDGGGKDIHPDGVEIGHAAAAHVFQRKKAGPLQQVFYRFEEFAIEMGDVIKEMLDEVPDCLLGFKVLLAAFVTIAADDLRLAVQAIFLLTFL